MGVRVYRRSYLIWPPVIEGLQSRFGDKLKRALPVRRGLYTLLVPQSRFGDKLLVI